MNKTYFGTILLALSLSACGPAPSDQAAPAAAEPASNGKATIEAVTSELISSSPASLPDCSNAVAALKWDVRSQPGVSQVKVMVRSQGNKEVLFSQSGPFGNASTDAWVKPGTTFVLRNAEGDAELASIVIGGPNCGAN